MPNANEMINLNIPIKAMLAAGRVRDDAQRPLTPFELMTRKGAMISLKKLWSDVHPIFTKCVGKIEQDNIKNHACPGFEGINFGRIRQLGIVKQYGHCMLRFSDKKVTRHYE